MRHFVLVSLVLLIALVAAMLAVVPNSVSAHQSGCHRWHSCPSDSGSYVCGDTGYSNYCGTEQTYEAPRYVAPVVDYAANGRTNGTQHATRDTSIIRSSALSSAKQRGVDDANDLAVRSPNAIATGSCRRAFTFDIPQEQAYVDGYTQAYEDQCTATYKTVYASTYLAAYNERETQIKKDRDAATWWWVIGIGVTVWVVWTFASFHKL
jgi:hypothetical protein